MTYANELAALNAADPMLGAQVARLPNLEAILKWAPGSGISLSGVDLLQQDEYSYDLFLPLPDGKRWLVSAYPDLVNSRRSPRGTTSRQRTNYWQDEWRRGGSQSVHYLEAVRAFSAMQRSWQARDLWGPINRGHRPVGIL